MSARAIGTVTVSFGLVTIPVKLYSTGVSGSGVSFNLLHAKCKSRVKQQYHCPTCNEQVERTDMVKGYEFAKGQYVAFTDEELKAVEQPKSEAIEIVEFLPLDKIDPVYFEKSYYLGPDKGAEKSYRLLGEAMRKTERAALARYAARGKQYLVLLRPLEEGLAMHELRYADEVKAFSEVPIGDSEPKKAEVDLAIKLIEQVAVDEFHPENFHDDVKDRIKEQIQRKVDGQEITAAAPAAPEAQIIDLMEALKASLAASPAKSGEARKGPKRAAPTEAAPAAAKSGNGHAKRARAAR